MERYSMFLGRKNQYYENDCITNTIYRFNVIPTKLPAAFFTELEQKLFTIHMETQKTPNSQNNPDKEKQSWRNQPSLPQTMLQIYKATVIKTVLYWHKAINTDQ